MTKLLFIEISDLENMGEKGGRGHAWGYTVSP